MPATLIKHSNRIGRKFLISYSSLKSSNISQTFYTLLKTQPSSSILNTCFTFSSSTRSFSTYLQKRPTTILKSNSLFKQSSRMPLVTISNSLKDSLTKNEIIPTVIHNKDFQSKGFLIISYGGEDKQVTMGNTLKVEETQSKPSISFTLNLPTDIDQTTTSNSASLSLESEPVFSISAEDNFTLVLTDPDAPTKADDKWSEYCHYITKNIKLNAYNPNEQITISNIQDKLTTPELSGVELVPYLGPGPPPKTGKHRYVFLLYRQKPGLEPEAPVDRPCYGTGIPGYGAEEWSKLYELELLAVNFFYAQNKDQ